MRLCLNWMACQTGFASDIFYLPFYSVDVRNWDYFESKVRKVMKIEFEVMWNNAQFAEINKMCLLWPVVTEVKRHKSKVIWHRCPDSNPLPRIYKPDTLTPKSSCSVIHCAFGSDSATFEKWISFRSFRSFKERVKIENTHHVRVSQPYNILCCKRRKRKKKS